jgi:hypothetical protein
MHIQYVGFDLATSSRVYAFHVIDALDETREFTIKVQSEAFRAGCLKFQDGPGICFARLAKELQGETPESHVAAHLDIEAPDIQGYMERYYPQKHRRPRSPIQGHPS